MYEFIFIYVDKGEVSYAQNEKPTWPEVLQSFSWWPATGMDRELETVNKEKI